MLKGIVLGLTLAALIGPVFFVLLQTSLQRGFFAGFLLAIGISTSDGIYIYLTNYFLSYIKSLDDVEFFLGIFGGFILVIIGVITMLKKPQPQEEEEDTSNGKSLFRSVATVVRGFLLNFAHPGVLIFWLGVVTLINSNWDYDTDQKVTLYSATIITIFTTDLLKAFLAYRIKGFLTFRLLLWINRIMRFVLLAFGTHLFFSTVLS